MKTRLLSLLVIIAIWCSARAQPVPKQNLGTVFGYTTGNFGVTDAGTTNYSIPLVIPPGTSGTAPKLSLSYDSQGNNGMIGSGWNLQGLSAITRSAQTYAQDGQLAGISLSTTDRFALDGERLIVSNNVAYGSDQSQYVTEQNNFSRIVCHTAVYGTAIAPLYFVVFTKSGMTMEYGNTDDSRIQINGSVPVYWLLNKVSDKSGNYYTITYQKDAVTGEYYPDHMDYTGNVTASINPYCKVEFKYEPRPDNLVRYFHGLKMVSCTKRLKSVISYYQNTLVRQYQLSYQSAPGPVQTSQLVGVKEYGSDNTAYPATVFNWGNIKELKYQPTEMTNIPCNAADSLLSIDVNSDGVMDIIKFPKNGIVEIYKGNKDTTNLTYSPMPISPSMRRDGNTKVTFGDFNGDGRTDILLYTASSSTLYLNMTKSRDASANFIMINGPVPVSSNTTLVAIDLNSDGRSDIVTIDLSNGSNQTFLSTSKGTTFSYLNNQAISNLLPMGLLNDEDTQPDFGDFNGDGLIDVLFYNKKTGATHLYINQGGFSTSLTEKATNIIDPTILAAGTTSGACQLYTQDMNGDGLPDIIFRDGIREKLSFWLNNGDNGFIFQKSLTREDMNLTLDGFETADFYFNDFNADGYLDILYRDVKPAGMINGMKFFINDGNLNFTYQDVPFAAFRVAFQIIGYGNFSQKSNFDFCVATYNQNPFTHPGATYTIKLYRGTFGYNGLVTGISQGNGSNYRVSYDYLSNDALYRKGETSVYPLMDYQASHFVVSRYVTDDGIGGLKSISYAYGQARIQVDGRGFRGFGFVQSRDNNTGSIQIKHFKTDADSWQYVNSPMIGITTKLYTGAVISKTSITPGLKTYIGGKSNYSYPAESTTTNYELSGNVVNTVTTKQTADDWGNVLTNTTDYGEGYVDFLTNVYANDESTWKLGRLTFSTLQRNAPSGDVQIRSSAFTYTTNGLLETEISEPNASATIKTVKTYSYDSMGNIIRSSISAWDGQGIVSRDIQTQYDPQGRFITIITNPLNQNIENTYEPLLGHLISQKSLNGLVTKYGYDGFGRLTTTLLPDGNWTITYFLKSFKNQTLPEHSKYLIYKEASNGPPITEYYDLLDRVIKNSRAGFDGRAIFQDVKFDKNGYVAAESTPYFEGQLPRYNLYEYDLLGRRIKLTAPDNSVSKVAYNGNTTTYRNAMNQQKTIVRDSKQQVTSTVDNQGNRLVYTYNAAGNLLSTTDPQGNKIAFTYDIRGMKTEMSDPDLGIFKYENNSFGQVIEQKDAQQRVIHMEYDPTGRPLKRTDADGVTQWQYDTSLHGVGLPASITSYDGYSKNYTYDQFGRLLSETQQIKGKSYRQKLEYDNFNRIKTIKYPSGFMVKRSYNVTGYLAQITDAYSGRIYWSAKAVNANGQVEKQIYGNGVELQKTFDPNNFSLKDIKAIKNSSILQKMSFVYDVIGNVISRYDLLDSREEDFTYDDLNRLTSSRVRGYKAVDVAYNNLGNIVSKTDAGDYQYGTIGNNPHQLLAVNGYASRSGFNMAVTYNSFHKASEIKNGDDRVTISYNADQQRVFQQLYKKNKLVRTKIYVSGYMEQEVIKGDTTTSNYIVSPEGVFAVFTKKSHCIFSKLQYLYRDHLGSVVMVTNRIGRVIKRYSFDAWGKQRNVDWSPAIGKRLALFKDRGYTGLEHYDLFDMIDMNGRLYDPTVGRFLTADPSIPNMNDLQSFNRFSYVNNNPMRFIDPTGYFGFGDIVGAIGGAIGAVGSAIGSVGSAIGGGVAAIGSFVSHVASVSANWVGQNWQTLAVVAVSIGVGALTGGAGLTLLGAIGSGAAVGFAGATVSTLLAGGNIGAALSAGLKGAVIGGITAGATFEVGELLEHTTTTSNLFGKIASHGTVQGLASVANGGKFIHGFYAGAVTPLGSMATSYLPSDLERVVAASVIGGTTSELSGGKFANGAVSAAFVQMYNEEAVAQTQKEIETGKAVLDAHGEIVEGLGYFGEAKMFGNYSTKIFNATENVGYAITGANFLVDINTGNGYETTWDVVSFVAGKAINYIPAVSGKILGNGLIQIFHATPTAGPELDQMYYRKSPSGSIIP